MPPHNSNGAGASGAHPPTPPNERQPGLTVGMATVLSLAGPLVRNLLAQGAKINGA